MKGELINMYKHQLTIIIPAFNAEKFIERCLDSLVEQEGDYEVIVVNDGSSDNTKRILEKYSCMNSFIKVINQDNAGVSAARNAALNIISGRYFTFVDADDWMEKDFLKGINPYLMDNYDVILFGRYFNTEDTEWTLNPLYENIKELTDKDLVEIVSNTCGHCDEHLRQDTDLFGWNGCKIYRTDLLGKTRFDRNVKFGEDTLFALEMLLKIKKMICIPSRFYHYYIHNESVTHKKNEVICEQVIEMMKKLDDLVPTELLQEERIVQAIYQRTIYKLMFCIDLGVFRGLQDRSFGNNVKLLSNMLGHQYFREALDNINLSPFRIQNKLKIWLLKNKMCQIYILLLMMKSVKQ